MNALCDYCIKPLYDAGYDPEIFTINTMAPCDICGRTNGAFYYDKPYRVHAVGARVIELLRTIKNQVQ